MLCIIVCIYIYIHSFEGPVWFQRETEGTPPYFDPPYCSVETFANSFGGDLSRQKHRGLGRGGRGRGRLGVGGVLGVGDGSKSLVHFAKGCSDLTFLPTKGFSVLHH